MGTFVPSLPVTSAPGIRSPGDRIAKPRLKTTDKMPHFGPGYYDAPILGTTSPAVHISTHERWGTGPKELETAGVHISMSFIPYFIDATLLSCPIIFNCYPLVVHHALTLHIGAPQLNPPCFTAEPGSYDPHRYYNYMRGQKILMLERCALKEQEVAKTQTSKWGNGNAGDAAWQEIIAKRPALDLTSVADKRAWSKGPKMILGSRFTPREKRPRTATGHLAIASPKHWLKSHTGSPNGMTRIIFEYGRMRAKHLATTKGTGVLKKPKLVPGGPGVFKWVGVEWPLGCSENPEIVPVANRPQTAATTVDYGDSSEAEEAGVIPQIAVKKKPVPELYVKTVCEDSNHITDVGFRILTKGPNGYGNPYRSSFVSTSSRDKLPGAVGIPETQKPDCPIGPGYYEI